MSETLQTSDAAWHRAQSQELSVWRGLEERSLWYRVRRFAFSLAGIHWDDGDDWHHWWKEKFDNYEVVPRHLNNVLEAGCGPYTNLRVILEGRQAQHVYCSDPLARHYITFKHRWLARAHRVGAVMIDDHPLEECPFASGYFDLTVMINVLDHVRDALLCLEQVKRVTAPGGLVVLGQDLVSADALNYVDPLHPIRILQPTMDEAVAKAFEPLLHRVLPREQSRNPDVASGTWLFIGRKRL